MRRLRAFWIGLLAFVIPTLGLIQSGASWAMVALFAALHITESTILTFAPPDGVATLAALLAASLGSRAIAAVLALRAVRRSPPPLPWPRRWYALPVWLGLLFVAMPDTWIGAGFDVYIVPSGSMEPTLRIGERFFARTQDHAPPGFRRGEILVFRVGPGEGVDYVKRLIGLPGDVVQLREGRLYLNGEALRREAIGPYPGGGTLYREALPGGAAHEILELGDDGHADNTAEFRVPEGHLFFLGDNRDNSLDSRMAEGMGFVPVARVTARARFVLWGPDRARIGARLD